MSFEEKLKSDKKMMEKFYMFCEYEKSCKRKRKSQESFKKRKLENSVAISESSHSESEKEERIKVQDSGKSKISKSTTQKKLKSNDKEVMDTSGNNNICAGVHIIPFSIPFGIDKFERNGGKFFKWGQIVLKG